MSSQKKQLKGFGSTAIHAGHETEGNYAHLTPIYASSTYVFDTAEQGCAGLTVKKKVISTAGGAIRS